MAKKETDNIDTENFEKCVESINDHKVENISGDGDQATTSIPVHSHPKTVRNG